MQFIWETTNGPFRYPEDLGELWTILFYYGGDFTPVAATELLGLSALSEDFFRHGSRLLAISPDSKAVHLAFLDSLARYRSTTPINFPLATDRQQDLSRALSLESDKKYIWILDPAGQVQAHFSYPLDTGVNFTEILRTLLALQQTKPTPHGWVPGAHALLPPPTTRESQITHINETESAGNYCIDWYLCYEGEAPDFSY